MDVHHSGIGLSYGGQVCEFGPVLVLGQNRPIGVNVVHRQKERDCFHFGPVRLNEQQESYFKSIKTARLQTILSVNVASMIPGLKMSPPVFVNVFLQ